MSLAPSPSSHARWSSIVDTMAAAAPHVDSKLEQAVEDLAALVDLVERVAAAGDSATACHAATSELQDYLGCGQVAVGLVGRSGSTCRLKAISGQADFDRAVPLTRAIESALDEALLRGAAAAWPPANDVERHALAAQRQLADLSGATAVLTVPLARCGESPIGACTVLSTGEPALAAHQQRFIKACAGPLAAALSAARRGEQRPWLRALQRVAAEKIAPRRNLLAALAMVVAAAMFVPLPYRVGCECQLQPVTRRVVAAPFAGTLQRSLVKPGDVVRRGDVLGRMDGREIRWELAGLIADQDRAAKSRDVNLAENKVSAAQIDALEMQRLEVKRRLLADRASHLEIKSPIDGVVTSGDLKRAEGAPVSVGQVLYEVAPLDRLVAEVAIADDDVSHARTGQNATISLDAFSGKTWDAQVSTIEPRSEEHDGANVFIAEVNLDNRDLALRPGMKGHAKLETENHALGWILFHKPWSRVVGWLGW